MTIPALRELRRIFSDAHISLHTRTWAQGIFQDAEFIDRIIPFEVEKPVVKTIHRQARIWQENEFDLAVIFPNSFESALLAKLGRVPRRFGYAKEARSVLLTDAVRIPGWKNEKHEIFYYLNLIAEIEKTHFQRQTVLHNPPRFELHVSKRRQEQARKLLVRYGIEPGKKIIALVAGSTNSRAKRWPADHFALLSEKFQKQLDAQVILLGSAAECSISAEVSVQSDPPPVDLTGKTTIAEVTAILSVCDLLIANDTGPAHIAAALGTRTLVLFGPTNPETTRPWNAEIIRREDVDCSPCMLRDCPIDHRCLEWIQPAAVFEKARALI